MNARTRYRCQEFRDDAELVLNQRAHPETVVLHQSHMNSCRDCRRFFRVLVATYDGPRPPATDPITQERVFEAILQRLEPGVQPRRQRFRLLQGSAVAAAVIATTVFFARPGSPEILATAMDVGHIGHESMPAARSPQIPDLPGFSHRAQGFGRVIAGQGVHGGSDRAVTPDTFPVGSTFRPRGASLQMGLLGKILANLADGSNAAWSVGSPDLVELTLERGMIAVRYERQPGDPILQIRTPTTRVRVTGTVFTVAVEDSGKTAVSVLRGEVEVLDLHHERLLAQVEAGYRFDVSRSTYADLGRREVAAALPLSSADGAPDGEVPASWIVPGMASDAAHRSLQWVPDHNLPTARRRTATASPGHATLKVESDLLEALIAETARARSQDASEALAHCRVLYASAETRFRAAACLTSFMHEYDALPEAVDGLLMIGILRMDFAHDYQSATRYFDDFLERAPNHEHAELARYKLVLAAIESGRIDHALDRGREYVTQHPGGQYLGRVVQRLPELKSLL